MNSNNAVLAFFELDQPCPPEIPLCSQLRTRFIEEMNNAKLKHCKNCEMTSIRSKYTTVVWEMYMEHITNKDKKQDILL
jgi:Zn-finger protein